MSFRDKPLMFTPAPAHALLPHQYAYVPTTTERDWSVFDRPAKERITAKRLRPARVLSITRQAG